MADQTERIAVDIIAAINRINASVQGLSTYISGHSYAFGTTGVVESDGVSALLAGIAIDVELISSIAATSAASGHIEVIMELVGSAVAASTSAGDLYLAIDLPEGSTGELSSVIGDLVRGRALTSSSTIAAALVGILSGDVHLKIRAASAAAAIAEANINITNQLAGSSVGVLAGTSAKLWV